MPVRLRPVAVKSPAPGPRRRPCLQDLSLPRPSHPRCRRPSRPPIHCAFSANHCRHSDNSRTRSDNNFTCSDNYFARLAHRCTRSAFHFACSVIHCTLSAFHCTFSASHCKRLAFHFTRLVVHCACSVIHCTRLAPRCTPSAERFRPPAPPSAEIFLFLLVFLFATHGKRSNCIVTAQDDSGVPNGSRTRKREILFIEQILLFLPYDISAHFPFSRLISLAFLAYC